LACKICDKYLESFAFFQMLYTVSFFFISVVISFSLGYEMPNWNLVPVVQLTNDSPRFQLNELSEIIMQLRLEISLQYVFQSLYWTAL